MQITLKDDGKTCITYTSNLWFRFYSIAL